MYLKNLEGKHLKKEELQQIKAGLTPDCEPGEVDFHSGEAYICHETIDGCEWLSFNDPKFLYV